jgi:hypothetical protein
LKICTTFENKSEFSTIHGIEKKCVFVLNFGCG